MNLLDLRGQVISALQARFPDLKIEPHGGRFDLVELDNYGAAAPEVRVAVLSAARSPRGRSVLVVAQLAAYVVAKRDRVLKADERGLAIASALLSFLADFTTATAARPEALTYQNLYTADVRERAVHLSAITWSCTFELVDPSAAALEDFLLFAASYDLGPEPDTQIEASDTVSLPAP